MEFALKIPEDMRKRYIERRSFEIQPLEKAVEAGNFEYLNSLGHQLRGNAPTFGYEQLAQLGRKMELAAQEHDSAEAMNCLLALKAWVQEQSQAGEDG